MTAMTSLLFFLSMTIFSFSILSLWGMKREEAPAIERWKGRKRLTTAAFFLCLSIFIAGESTRLLTNLVEKGSGERAARASIGQTKGLPLVSPSSPLPSRPLSGTLPSAQQGGTSGLATPPRPVTPPQPQPEPAKRSGLPFGELLLLACCLCLAVPLLREDKESSFLVDLVGAYRGVDIDQTKELLIRHAIESPSDRRWVERILGILQGETKQDEIKGNSLADNGAETGVLFDTPSVRPPKQQESVGATRTDGSGTDF